MHNYNQTNMVHSQRNVAAVINVQNYLSKIAEAKQEKISYRSGSAISPRSRTVECGNTRSSTFSHLFCDSQVDSCFKTICFGYFPKSDLHRLTCSVLSSVMLVTTNAAERLNYHERMIILSLHCYNLSMRDRCLPNCIT